LCVPTARRQAAVGAGIGAGAPTKETGGAGSLWFARDRGRRSLIRLLRRTAPRIWLVVARND